LLGSEKRKKILDELFKEEEESEKWNWSFKWNCRYDLNLHKHSITTPKEYDQKLDTELCNE
jgi:hypothetical protein